MGARGKKSASELTACAAGPKSRRQPPQPPQQLCDEGKRAWLSVVNALPPDWFGSETHRLLVQYCNHCAASAQLQEFIQRYPGNSEFQLDEFDRLLKMQEREGRAMSSLATRLRITKQATTHKDTSKPSKGRRPWEPRE